MNMKFILVFSVLANFSNLIEFAQSKTEVRTDQLDFPTLKLIKSRFAKNLNKNNSSIQNSDQNVEKQPSARKLTFYQDFFNNINNIVKEAIKKYEFGNKAQSQNDIATLEEVQSNPDTEKKYKFVFPQIGEIFNVKIILSGLTVVCLFESEELSNFIEVEYFENKQNGKPLLRIKQFIEEWVYRCLEKMDQLVFGLGFIKKDLEKVIAEETASSSDSNNRNKSNRKLKQIANGEFHFENDTVQSRSLENSAQSEVQNDLKFPDKTNMLKVQAESQKKNNKIVEKNINSETFKKSENISDERSLKLEINSAIHEKTRKIEINENNLTQNQSSFDDENTKSKSFEIFLNSFESGVTFEELKKKLIKPSSRNLYFQNKVLSKSKVHADLSFEPDSKNPSFAKMKHLGRKLIGPNELSKEGNPSHTKEKLSEMISRIENIKKNPEEVPKNAELKKEQKEESLYFSTDLGLGSRTDADFIQVLLYKKKNLIYIVAESSYFKYNYEIRSLTKRIVIQKIQKIIHDFWFLQKIVDKFLEKESSNIRLIDQNFLNIDRPRNVVSKFANLAVLNAGKATTISLSIEDKKKDKFQNSLNVEAVVKNDDSVGQSGSQLSRMLPFHQRLVFQIKSPLCNFEYIKDYPTYSMFDTSFLAILFLKTAYEVINRQFHKISFSDSNESLFPGWNEVDFVNPFVDIYEVPDNQIESAIFRRIKPVYRYPAEPESDPVFGTFALESKKIDILYNFDGENNDKLAWDYVWKRRESKEQESDLVKGNRNQKESKFQIHLKKTRKLRII